MIDKKPLIVIAGPTASGKSDRSVAVAKRIGGEIISADSMQVYKKLDIGTAKITKEEMQGVTHHLIDVASVADTFSIADYKCLANEAIRGIYERGHVPILCGGTGFYIQSVIYDIDFSEEEDKSIRVRLNKELEEKGAFYMHEKLSLIDPESAAIIHANNTKRVIRALEFYELHGSPISEHNKLMKQREPKYDVMYYAFTMDRDVLYDRIDRRVDIMLESGLLDEARWLFNQGLSKEHTCMQAIGYKEMIEYIKGDVSYDEAVAKLKLNTRHYAKRQLTWFRNERGVRFIDVMKEDAVDMIVKEYEKHV